MSKKSKVTKRFQKNWCSKHQRVHKERRHKSCKYPYDNLNAKSL